MFKRLFFAVLVVTTSISTGFLATATPASAGTKNVARGIFDISRLDAEHQILVEEALACDDFNYGRLRKALRRQTGRSTIKVTIEDLSRYGAVGASWQSGELRIDDDELDPHYFQQVFMHEIGHMVDFYFLAPKKLHKPIAQLYGAPWKTMGHDFNGGFTSAFSCFDAGDANGYLDETKIQTLRTMLGGEGLPPEKTL